MATRILTPWYLLHQDSGFPAVNFDVFNASKNQGVNVQQDHYKIIRAVGATSTVLQSALPLKKAKSIALISADTGPTIRL
ncbi:hypothetical protein BC936DRAFT_140647 [Jimgerdemannia flammicorona]|nr:hypothetical protein BC936DRAFT_140647 [Jimgerdemannia flammicorona]